MTRIIIALAMLVALGHEANSQASRPAAVPRLKQHVIVTSEIVRIGDLVENAGAAADIPIFRAPDLGQTGTVNVARIAEALRPHDVAAPDADGLTEVAVTRLSRTITRKDIADRLARAFAGQFGLGEARNLSIILDRDIRPLQVEATATADLAVSRMYADPRTGRFDVTLELPGSAAARRLPLRFTGTVAETVEAATLVRAIRPGEILKASDVMTERRRKSEAGGDALGAEQAVGLAARRPLRGGQVLRPDDLMKPQIVQRNEAVTIQYEVPGIRLTVRGKALEAGAMGDIVSVLNIQSNRTVQGTVTGPGRVTMTAAPTFVAAAADPANNGPVSNRTQ